MSESILVPVEYIITTTSDWTVFQITEGGLWTDLQINCTEGQEKLVTEITHGQTAIAISKKAYDQSTVVVHIKCNLEIKKQYWQSSITYLITKGDIQSSTVQVLAGNESHTLVNDKKVPNDSRNPLYFQIPVRRYLDALKQMAKSEVGEQSKEKIRAIHESEQHIIVTVFNKMFKEIFEKKEPTEKDVAEVFEYLRSNGKNAAKFLDAETCRDLTLQTQACFWRFPNLKNKVGSEASKTLEEIRKRYDGLRKIEGNISFQATGFGGIEKGEKKVAPKE
jgi:hypothetical protein